MYKDVNKSTNSDAVVSKRFGSRITISNAIIFKDIDPVQRDFCDQINNIRQLKIVFMCLQLDMSQIRIVCNHRYHQAVEIYVYVSTYITLDSRIMCPCVYIDNIRKLNNMSMCLHRYHQTIEKYVHLSTYITSDSRVKCLHR